MLLIVAGAGASFDSVPARSPGRSALEEHRPPLADALFESRPAFEEYQRRFPHVMQIAPTLLLRSKGRSVEDVLGEYAGQIGSYPQRLSQLAAVRFYLQAVINHCEQHWCRGSPVATNWMALIDQIECHRGSSGQPLMVTFNYDRLIEQALENRGQSFDSLDSYIGANSIPLIKLHGSTDWFRPIQRFDHRRFGGDTWRIANQICEVIRELPEPGPIERGAVPASSVRDHVGIPAIAIPTKSKSAFECPDAHSAFVELRLREVSAVLTIGWRGAEQHFLRLLSKTLPSNLEYICVGSGRGSAEETCTNLQRAGLRGHFEPYNNGFTNFVITRGVERLCNVA